MLSVKKYKDFEAGDYSFFVLGADVGGTNTSFGIFGIKNNNSELLLSFHFKSKELNGLSYAVNEALKHVQENYNLKITKACFAVAGCLSSDKESAKTTNIGWDVSKKDLLNKTALKKICIINDFEAIGYSIPLLKNKDLKVIKKADRVSKAPILVIGAGTGMGKVTLVHDGSSYIPINSEAGHSDFPAQAKIEMDLVNFIKKYKRIRQSVTYEQVLSGPGLVNIYLFLRKSGKFKGTRFTKEIDNDLKPELISRYRKIDKTCKETFEIFRRIYARFARNFALDCLAWGGVYIAGGIAPKNKEIFDREFARIFGQSRKIGNVLKKIPVYLVLNSDAGLLGAGYKAKFL